MKQPEELLAVVRRSRLFERVSADDLKALLGESRWRKFPADSYLFREGDPADHLLIVASGEVKISRATESGSDVVFAVLGPGDALGELGALEEGASRSADARALSEAECLVIHRPALVRFLTAHPVALWGVVNVLTAYIRTKDEAFVDLAVRDIPGRVARKLLDLAGSESTLTLSQSTLAGLVGASRENVNRALSRFASLGYIRIDRGRLTLLRKDELRRRGE
ncbi:MAG TPA: Crp/Fnr family transcriptional regulator [Candidatus Dormibacteraeota bacterium]|nr:Crp/Fnr family transcriptional regulator [Candidatus Dormibacteraeota bacterium]